MKIESGHVPQGQLEIGQREKASRLTSGGTEGERAGRSTDGIALSSRLRQIRQLAGEVGSVRSVDHDLVAVLRSRVGGSDYAPPSDSVAAALVRSLRGGDV